MVRSARHIRENIRFVAGLAGLGFEMIVEHSDRPILLGVFAAMIGLDVIAGAIIPRGGPPNAD